tara:strand:+ start:12505 stop:13857 length:1353 start_codon:yes stop_codon:yes gene_type:complete
MIGKYSIIILLTLVLMAYGCVVESDYGPRPIDTFIKYYGISGSNEVVDMIISNEGNLVILGNEESSASGASKDIVILEIDTVGNLIKKKIFDVQSLFSDDNLYAFGITDDEAVRIKTIDDGYLLCANFTTKDDNVNGLGSKIFWCELDNNYNIVGKQVISDVDYYWEVGDIIKSRDGNIVIVGGTNKKEEGDNAIRPEKQRYLTKRSIENDTVFWSKTFGYDDVDDFAIGVFELSDRNLGVIGITGKSGNQGEAGVNATFAIFTDIGSSSSIDNVYGFEFQGDADFNDNIGDFIYTETEDVIIVGTSTSNNSVDPRSFPFLFRIRKAGSLVFKELLSSSILDLNSGGMDVTIGAQNDLIITGVFYNYQDSISKETYNDQVLFKRTNQFGKVTDEYLFYQNHFGLTTGNDIGKAILTLPDGSIAIAATIDFGNSRTLISYLKVNNKGTLKR